MDVVCSVFEKLHLECLEDAWVDAIDHSDFLEFGEIPSEYATVLEQINIKSVFHSVMNSIGNWLKNETDTTVEKSWAPLSSRVHYKKLLALIGYHIDLGGKDVVTKEHRNNAILASRLYFKLLSIPGYKAYHIYHSQLFANSLSCLGFPKLMCDKDDCYNNTRELAREVNSVIMELSSFVLDLKFIMGQLQLSPTDMNFEDILSNLVDITGGAIVNRLDVDKAVLGALSGTIYEMIDIMLCDSEGPNDKAIRLLFKTILPKLIAASLDTRNANNVVRASYVTYSGVLLTKYGQAALDGYTILLEHLCYTVDGLERAEVRAARVSLILGLMSLLPQKSYKRFVSWLLKLSETNKISHRQIALELLAKILSNEPEDPEPAPRPRTQSTTRQYSGASNNGNEEQVNQDENNVTGVINGTQEGENNVAEAEQPTNEAVATENATANGTPESNEKSDMSEKPESGEKPNANKESTDKATESDNPLNDILPPITDESSQDNSTDGDDPSPCGVLSVRAARAAHAGVLRAVYARAHDASGSLRARALAVLADAAADPHPHIQQALKELNGDGPVTRLHSVAARAACDERAVVRRAAAALTQRLLAAKEGPAPTATDLSLLVGLCRDASVMVRAAAIGALGEAAARAGRAATDAFLAGPMHQLSDPETRIQDQVLTLVQHLLIDRIKKHVGLCDDPIPWLLLDGIIRHNKRRHLQKACALLAKKNSCISVRLVDALSTHVGAPRRALAALVLLTSAARYVDYHNIDFVLDYYYQLAADDHQERDTRLMSLTLELLGLWSRFADTAQRTQLRDHIVKRLASPADDGCRIAAANLAAQLDPTNLQWATELMQLAERAALSSGSLQEMLRAADLALVAPQPPAPALLQRFLQLLSDTPDGEENGEIQGSCVAGIGRLCVRGRGAAAAAAPALAALLHHSAHLHAKVNALYVLTDICTRYTCIVEPLLGAVCGCVSRGAAAALRRAAARALTRLLLAGFLRLTTPLYYKYCALLADEDHDVREPAEYYVTSCLRPDVIYHHIVDCIIYYNKDDDDPLCFDDRQLIYDIMLQRLSLVQKLNVQCRIAREVLEHAADIVDEGDDIPPALNHALLDAIKLLCGPRMKLPKKPDKTGETADINDLQERVTTNIVSHKMKRTVAEVVVPAVLRLYARLRAGGGQLATYLVGLANDLLHDYRQEIEELIENDEELILRVQQFQETIGSEPSFGNARNLVTASNNVAEPETPRAGRKRAPRAARDPPRKRALRI